MKYGGPESLNGYLSVNRVVRGENEEQEQGEKKIRKFHSPAAVQSSEWKDDKGGWQVAPGKKYVLGNSTWKEICVLGNRRKNEQPK